jgi:hypothetical protein
MKTYQDLIEVGDSDAARMEFVRTVINDHKNSDLYRTAQIAEDYFCQRNTTITNFQKILFNLQGRPVDDEWSANHKLASNFFKRFVTQQNQFLLGNGITWGKPDTEEKLGNDFDTQIQKAGRYALCGAVSFGFWNLKSLVVFSINEFAPLQDEEDGALKAGVRFWQINAQKPLRATLYELDGYTDYIWEKQEGRILNPKRKYIQKVRQSEVDGTKIYDWENYPTFPIVPLWGNPQHQSEIVGIRSQIDAYDIVKSGFANDLDTAQVYWILHNAGGMDDMDLAQFLERLHLVHAATVDDAAGTAVDAHTVEIPSESREKLLDRLENDLYKDYMAFNPETIASGAATATQIRAAYEPINSKADEYEYCVIDFLKGILALAGIDDEPTFDRSYIINRQEEVQVLTMAASYLTDEYVTKKILTVLGDGDRADEILKDKDAEDIERVESIVEEEQPEMR